LHVFEFDIFDKANFTVVFFFWACLCFVDTTVQTFMKWFEPNAEF